LQRVGVAQQQMFRLLDISAFASRHSSPRLINGSRLCSSISYYVTIAPRVA
jgi:hypothetical protein